MHGRLSTNDGEVALNWALEGQGILMRAEWDVAKYLRSGRLVQVLADYETPSADVYAVYLERLNLSAKVAYFVEHLRDFLSRHADGPAASGSHGCSGSPTAAAIRRSPGGSAGSTASRRSCAIAAMRWSR